METNKVTMLFPGQGACYPGVLHQVADAYPQVNNVIKDVDAISRERFGRSVSELIWQLAAPSLEQMLADAPDVVQLAIYAVSISTFKVLVSEGVVPDILMGHSFGEIAALVCSGAFTIREGAEIVCERAEATRVVADTGYMAALSIDAKTADKVVALVGNHQTAIAAENAQTQTVVSGNRANMDRIAEIAKVLNVGFVRLNAPYPFHSPLMEPAKQIFKQRVERFQAKPLQIPVFSPILGRYYEAGDRIAEYLAEHLVRPVRFCSTVEKLYAEGARTFIEAGALDALTKLVRKTLPDRQIRTVAVLNRSSDELAAFRRSIADLRPEFALDSASVPVAGVLNNIPSNEAASFWAEHGIAIEQFIRNQYDTFRGKRSSVASPINAELSAPATSSISRAEVFRYLVVTYAAALEYPEEVFTESVELEAELGIDSVKQAELLARVTEKYGLLQRPAEFRLTNYSTMGRIADFIVGANRASTPANSSKKAADLPSAVNRSALMREIVTMYAQALEYPEEVFMESVELEAELGIDSVKQAELLARVSKRYGLPPRPADFRLSNYSTIGKVVNFVLTALGRTPASQMPVPDMNALSPQYVNGSIAQVGTATRH